MSPLSRRLLSPVLGAVLASAVALGCDKKEAPAPEAPSAEVAFVDPKPSEESSPLVDGYDGIRAALADDQFETTQKLAKVYKGTVSAEAPSAAKMLEGLDAIIASADIDAARDAFGTLSEGYIALLGERPALGEGLQAFRCPMARTYKKWVQRDSKMMNPYMGKAMLECGGPTELVP